MIRELAKKTFNQNNPSYFYASYVPYIKQSIILTSCIFFLWGLQAWIKA